MRAATVAFILALALASCVAQQHGCYLPQCKVIEGQQVWCEDIHAWHEYHRHPTSKYHFVQCTTYGPQVMSCAPTTVWCQDRKECVWERELPSCGDVTDKKGPVSVCCSLPVLQ